MRPLRGLGLSDHIAFLLVLHATSALKLDIPSDVVPGETLVVSWTSADGDPDTMDLFLSCDGGASYKMIASSVSTASASYTITVPLSDNLNLRSPLSCNVQARAMDDATVLDGTMVDVATLDTPSSESTWTESTNEPSWTESTNEPSWTESTNEPSWTESTNEPSPTPTVTPEESSTTSPSTLDPIISSTSESTQTFASLPTTSSSVTSSSASPQSSWTDVSSSRSAQSTRTLSNTSTDTTATPSTSTSSTISILPSANSPTGAASKSIGAIIGAVIGSILGLLILLALLLLLLYRRRDQRKQRRLSRQLRHMRNVRPDLPLLSNDKEEALLGAEEETSEASHLSATESNEYSDGSSLGHYHDGHTSPYNLDMQLQPIQFSMRSNSILDPVLRAADNGDQDQEAQYTYHSRSTSLKSLEALTREGSSVLHETGRPRNFSSNPMGYDKIRSSSSDSLETDTKTLDSEIRIQRRDALLERMRKVLDGEQSI